MNNLIIKTKLDDKYYKKYKYLFNYLSNKWHIINKYLLFNFIIEDNYKLCNYELDKFKYHEIYRNMFFINTYYFDSKFLSQKNIKFQTYYENYIIDKYENNNYTTLIIKNNAQITKYYTILAKKKNIDFINIYNDNYISIRQDIKNIVEQTKKHPLVNYNLFNKFYSTHFTYKQFLINLKNNKNTDSIPIPITKYKLITCHYDYMKGLSLSASYKMTLQIPHLISTIAMSLKLIEKNGTLLLFWSILNVHIPVIKKLLALLAYGFKTIEIIDDDINQNLLVGVPEYYIKCSGYKDNISNELITQLLEIAIDTLDNIYESCDILDYYEEYTEKNPNHTLFYNKKEKGIKADKNKRLTKKLTKKLQSNKKISNRKYSSTKKSSSSSSSSSSSASTSKKPITPVYYIEDINIPELNEIMKNSKLQFKVESLANKLESIFVGFFEMVNNLIENAIAKDEKGVMYVKQKYILERDIKNITRLITMFEYNKLPYNKHAISVLLDKKNELVDKFNSLHTPIRYTLINYHDKHSDDIDLENLNILTDYYKRIKISLQVRNKLLENVGFERAPKNMHYNIYDLGSGLSNFINAHAKDKAKTQFENLPPKIDMAFLKQWEILTTFKLIPENTKAFNILFLCEPSKQSIMACKYWVQQKCHLLKPEDYNWYANTINPYSKTNQIKLFKDVYDYDIIKNNFDKWIWGNDNSGEITNKKNLQSIVEQLQDKLQDKTHTTKKHTKLDLIISNGNINDKYSIGGFVSDTFNHSNTIDNSDFGSYNIDDNSNNDISNFDTQKMEISQVIGVIASSSIGGACCVKHFIPQINLYMISNDDSDNSYTSEYMKTNWMFISYLYLYYIAFDSMSLYKPLTSFTDNGEFYVICKGFKGVDKTMLDKLYNSLNKFKENDTLIDKKKIPKTFIIQLNNFLTKISDLNVETIEKQNLVLTCFETIGDFSNNYQINKILNCSNLINEKTIETMIIPKYKEWINLYEFV